MAFWAFGHDATSRLPREPLYLEVETEEQARDAATRAGMAVEFVERARDSTPSAAPTPRLPAAAAESGSVGGENLKRSGAMHYKVFCGCGAAIEVSEGTAGARVPCKCGQMVTVPGLQKLRSLPPALASVMPATQQPGAAEARAPRLDPADEWLLKKVVFGGCLVGGMVIGIGIAMSTNQPILVASKWAGYGTMAGFVVGGVVSNMVGSKKNE